MTPVVWCTELELSGDLPATLRPPAGRAAGAARVLVRLHGEPVGFVELPVAGDRLDVATVVKQADADLLDQINEHLERDGATPVAALGPAGLPGPAAACPRLIRPGLAVTVVVCTRDRGPALRECLARLRDLVYPRLEILIVDNAPSDDVAREVFHAEVGHDPRFRYLRELRPGLSCARNRGLREAAGDVVAFTDDDVSVDPDWIRALAAGFRHEGVACVTGLVCTASIEGAAERYFDARVSWGDSCRSRVWRLAEDDDGLFPYSPGVFGTGASFAVRADVMWTLGGFDEALGAGTRTAGGEDLDAFVRLVLAGHAIAYEPAAVVWHHHRADLSGLRRQMFAYGTGLSAFLAKHVADPRTRREVLRRVPRGARRLVHIGTGTSRALDGGTGAAQAAQPDDAAEDVPARALLLRELAGFAVGPVLYARARRDVPPAPPP